MVKEYQPKPNRYTNSGPVKSLASLSYEDNLKQLRDMGLETEARKLEAKYYKPSNDLMQIRDNNEAAARWVEDFNNQFRSVK